MRGLVIKSPYIDDILSGLKTWEMRSTHTRFRETIALIRKGSGTVVGTAEVVDSLGPISEADMLRNQDKHRLSVTLLRDPTVRKWNHAWVIRSACKLREPVPYRHGNGPVNWVILDAGVVEKIHQQL